MHSLTLALDGGEWSASCPGHLTPKERAPGTHCISLGGPQSRSESGGEFLSRNRLLRWNKKPAACYSQYLTILAYQSKLFNFRS